MINDFFAVTTLHNDTNDVITFINIPNEKDFEVFYSYLYYRSGSIKEFDQRNIGFPHNLDNNLYVKNNNIISRYNLDYDKWENDIFIKATPNQKITSNQQNENRIIRNKILPKTLITILVFMSLIFSLFLLLKNFYKKWFILISILFTIVIGFLIYINSIYLFKELKYLYYLNEFI